MNKAMAFHFSKVDLRLEKHLQNGFIRCTPSEVKEIFVATKRFHSMLIHLISLGIGFTFKLWIHLSLSINSFYYQTIDSLALFQTLHSSDDLMYFYSVSFTVYCFIHYHWSFLLQFCLNFPFVQSLFMILCSLASYIFLFVDSSSSTEESRVTIVVILGF